jgi:hypothetical protein
VEILFQLDFDHRARDAINQHKSAEHLQEMVSGNSIMYTYSTLIVHAIFDDFPVLYCWAVLSDLRRVMELVRGWSLACSKAEKASAHTGEPRATRLGETPFALLERACDCAVWSEVRLRSKE